MFYVFLFVFKYHLFKLCDSNSMPLFIQNNLQTFRKTVYNFPELVFKIYGQGFQNISMDFHLKS